MAFVLFRNITNKLSRQPANNPFVDKKEVKIEKKKKKKVKKSFKIENIKEFLDNHNCPICQDWIVAPVTLPCGHSFCHDCIKESNKSHDRNRSDHNRYECGVCRGKYSKDTVIGVNLQMDQTIKMIGGSKYKICLDKRMRLLKQKKLLEDYTHTGRFNNIKLNVAGFLRETPINTYQSIIEKCNFFYPELEVKYILHLYLLQKRIIIYKDKIIYKQQLHTFIQQNINSINSDDLIILSIDYIKDDGDHGIVKNALASKYNKKSKLHRFLNKISSNELNLISNIIENVIAVENGELDNEYHKICSNCGCNHNENEESSSSS
ncbi:MAG: hypothetical protein WD512_13900, partial [Candidatus Paceibacterota bacterium]